MTCSIIVGGTFGDEGKGKIVSYIATNEKPSICVRGGVGPNAGHTVVYGGKTLKFRMLPSAVVNDSTRLMIGAGVLVNPQVLLKELDETGSGARILVDKNCSLIEQKHLDADRKGHLKDTIGTTGTGTGPANSDRVLRIARRAVDEPSLQKYLGDVAVAVNGALDSGESVLVEGTQGTMLSLYHGSYPYVTSKDVSASGICSDVGIGPKRVDEVILVFKSYLTRVGAGPLSGELSPEETKKRGWEEYGSVTGRLRRAAPFDFELAKRSVMLNSATQIALTKLDSVFPEASRSRDYSKLAGKAKEFVENVENTLKVPVTYIGTGADSEDIIIRKKR
ncbi:MAG TPA: adenylosuccinate synthetase [Nitrososphaerales archaeon]|nr:adenylosuccinate synthetase [Nitrososphaerales archaeon]